MNTYPVKIMPYLIYAQYCESYIDFVIGTMTTKVFNFRAFFDIYVNIYILHLDQAHIYIAYKWIPYLETIFVSNITSLPKHFCFFNMSFDVMWLSKNDAIKEGVSAKS